MAENSAIEWTHHTFQAWEGCTKISPGCQNCYAESRSKRFGRGWGPKEPRKMMSESYWKEPLRWNREAQEAGERRRVFCASLADVFEGRDTMPEVSFLPVRYARFRLFFLIEKTPFLDWLLLTKRPQNIIALLPDSWQEKLPVNVWIGTSVEDQQTADERIPHLLNVPAKVRFLSMEPLLGPVTLWHNDEGVPEGVGIIKSGGMTVSTPYEPEEGYDDSYPGINWVICGGESGPKARPMHPDWARSLRDQCAEAGVPFFFKQWGEHAPISAGAEAAIHADHLNRVKCEGEPLKGDGNTMFRVGKKAAGRLLDGKTWDEMPEVTD
jgi:protein gp37